MKRILVIRGGAIGDFVLTLPTIKLLRDGFPHAHLEILGYKHIVALAENRFYADATRSIEYGPLGSFFARGADLPRDLADYFASFDLVVSYLFDPDGIFEQNLARCGVDIFVAVSPKITGYEHAAVQLAQPLGQLDLTTPDSAATLYLAPADRAFARSFLSPANAPVVALHPGSGSETKNWRLEHWAELGETLLRDGSAGSLLIVGGEADVKQLRSLAAEWRDRPVMFAEHLPLPELAAALSECALFIGHDSGVSHVAAAVGTCCVLLFGPTDPAVWAPANEGVQILRADSRSLGDLTVDEVRNAALARLRESRITS